VCAVLAGIFQLLWLIPLQPLATALKIFGASHSEPHHVLLAVQDWKFACLLACLFACLSCAVHPNRYQYLRK